MSPCVTCNRRAIRRGLALFFAVCGSTLAGCELFSNTASFSRTTANKIPQLRPPAGSIQLDVIYVERPVGDALLGDELWRQVDQIGSIDADTRGRIRQNGFRVGIVGANPPVALQKMLGLKSDFVSEPDAEQTKQLVGRRFFPVSGSEIDVQVSPVYPECSVNLFAGGQSELRAFENAVCKYRVRAVRLQDGWVRLEVVPQLHYGDDHLRHAVGESGWRLQNGRQSETFFLQRFDVKLGTGDMAVITAAEECAGTLGQLFFRGPAALQRGANRDVDLSNSERSPAAAASEHPIQRLLIIRLAGMDDTETLFSQRR